MNLACNSYRRACGTENHGTGKYIKACALGSTEHQTSYVHTEKINL